MTFVFKTLPVLLALLLASGGCVSSGRGSDQSQRDRNEVSQQEIEASKASGSAYNLIQRMRPRWLQKRGRNSITDPGEIIVYVDGARYGSPQALRRVQVVNVESMEYLNAAQATNRFGGGHAHGAILVHSKDG